MHHPKRNSESPSAGHGLPRRLKQSVTNHTISSTISCKSLHIHIKQTAAQRQGSPSSQGRPRLSREVDLRPREEITSSDSTALQSKDNTSHARHRSSETSPGGATKITSILRVKKIWKDIINIRGQNRHGACLKIIIAETNKDSDHQCAQGTHWKQQGCKQGRALNQEERLWMEEGSIQRLTPLKRQEECLGGLNGSRNGRGKSHCTEKRSEETSRAEGKENIWELWKKWSLKNITSIKLMQGGEA